MNTRKEIDLFLNNKSMAIAGVSRDPKKFGHLVYRTLREKGYDLYPINPNCDGSEDQNWFRKIEDLPDDVNTLLILTNKQETEVIVRDAIRKGIKNIWIQQHSETPEALKLISDFEINLISGMCIMMYADPQGFHKFHKNLSRLFGNYVG